MRYIKIFFRALIDSIVESRQREAQRIVQGRSWSL
jgi:hypothetical protein